MSDFVGVSTGWGDVVSLTKEADRTLDSMVRKSEEISRNLRNAFSQQGQGGFYDLINKAQDGLKEALDFKSENANASKLLETFYNLSEIMSKMAGENKELFDPTKIYASNESLTKLQEILNSTEGKINQVSETFKKLYDVQEKLNSATAEQDKKNARSSAISFLGEQGVTLAKNASNAVIQAKLKEVEEILKAEEKALIEEKRIAEETIKFNSSTAAEQIGLVRKTVDSILKEEERKRKEIQKNDEAYAKHNEQMLQNELSTTSMSAKQKEKIRQQESKQRLADIQEAFTEEERKRKEIQKNDEAYAQHSEAMLKNELENESFNQKRMAQIRKEASAERKADIESAFREEDARRENAEDYAKYEEEVYNRSLEKQREINRTKVAEDRAAYDERKRDIEQAFKDDEEKKRRQQEYLAYEEDLAYRSYEKQKELNRMKSVESKQAYDERKADIKQAFDEEDARINKIKDNYKDLQALLSANLTAKSSFEKIGVSNLTTTEKNQYQNVLERERNLRSQIEDMERKHQEILSELIISYADKNAKRTALTASNRIKKEESEWQAFLKTYEGATAYASEAKTEKEEAKAIQYLIEARKNLIKTDSDYADKKNELNKLIEKFRISIEQATKAEQNEKTLQPKIANEYAKLLVEIDKLVAAKEKLSQTDAYKNNDPKATQDMQAMEARLNDINARRLEIEESAQGQLDEIYRKHEANRAVESVNAVVKSEQEKAKKMKEFAKKYATITSTDALASVTQSKNTQNIAQAEKAIQDLKIARDKLDNTDSQYVQTVAALNEEIKRQEEYIESVTKAEEHQKKQEEEYNRTRAGAMAYAEKAKSVGELKKAIDYLQSAMDKEDISTKEGKKNYREMSEELNNLKERYSEVTGESKKFTDITEIVGSKLKAIFSVAAIRGYVNEIIKVRKEFELQNRALQAIIQNADKANQIWDKTVALAVQSPFTVKQLVTYTKQLAAYRIETDKLYDTTKMLADVSAGLGVDMDRLILAYGQVRAASYLRGTELRQFTEAGIPMLDELAKRFTELEGRAVSVGDVFTRISKRMVSFNDVAEVFNNLTREGGTFYRMQEIQAETLYGQLSNLRDAIDIMFNEIGKANDGVLKNLVATLRSIINNYREWIALIKIVGISVGVSVIKSFGRGAISVMKYGTRTTAVMHGMTAAGGKTIAMFQTLWKTIAKKPFLAVAGAATALTTVILNHIKAVNSANKKYDELSIRENNQITNYIKIADEIDKNNKLIEENRDAAENDAEAKERLVKAQEGNKIALEELNKLYPKTATLIEQQEDGILNYNEALKEENRLLSINIALQQGGKADFFHDDFIKNYQDATEALSKYDNAYESLKNAARASMVQAQYSFKQGKLSVDDYNKSVDALTTIINSSKEDLISMGDSILQSGGLSYAVTSDTKKAYDTFVKFHNRFTKSLDDLTWNIKQQVPMWSEGIAEFDLNGEQGKRDAAAWVNSQLDALGVVDGEIKKWAQQEIEQRVNVRLIWAPADNIEAELEGWKKSYDENFKKDSVRYNRYLLENPETQQADVIKELNDMYKERIDLLEKIEKAGEEATEVGGAYEGENIENIKKETKELKNQLLWFGVDPNAKKSQTDWIAKMISLVKDMNKSYEDLNKTFDKTTSEMNTMTSFEDAFKETFGKTGLKIGDLDFTTPEGVAAFLEKLLPYVKTLGSKYVQELQKAIADYKVEIGITAKQDSDKDIKKQVEDMFDQYDLTLELKELDIPQDLAKNLFKVDYTSLDDLREKLVSMRESFIGKDMLDEYDKFMEKLNDMEIKAAKERMKTYSKYLMEGMSERVKITVDGLKKIKEVEESSEFDEYQKKRIKEGISKETRAELQKQQWEEFKNTDIYTMMFDDIENMGTTALTALRDRLKELKYSLKDLPTAELRRMATQLSKIEEEIAVRNPFKALADSMRKIKELKSMGLTEDVLQAQFVQSESLKASYQEELDNVNLIISRYDDKVALQQLSRNEEGKYAKYLGMSKEELEEMSSTLSGNIVIQDDILDRLLRQLGIYSDAERNADAVEKTWNNILSLTKKAYSSISDILDTVDADAYGISQEVVDTTFSLAEGVMQMVSLSRQISAGTEMVKIFGVEMKVALGPLGYILIALEVVARTLKAIFSIKSKNIQKQLDQQERSIERLQRSYENLEEAIDKAWSTDQMVDYYDQMKKNIELQIQSTKSAIAALSTDKKSSKVGTDEWKQLQDLLQKLNDLQKKLEEVDEQAFDTFTDGVLSNVMDAASGFTESWLDAFNETGDGLDGLEDNFEEMLKNIATKQAAMMITGQYVERWKEALSKFTDDGKLSPSEIEQWAASVRGDFPELNDALKAYFEAIKDVIGGGNNLSGLTKGIQGMTEEQADILAAYWNSVRQYTASIDEKISSIIHGLNFNDEANPMISQLKIIARQTNNIYDLLDGLTASYPNGGRGFKIVMSD